MNSDYLDTSNPRRLLAFFQFCDVANNARAYVAALDIEDSLAKRAATGIMESLRQRAEQSAIDTLSGQPDFFAMVESNLDGAH